MKLTSRSLTPLLLLASLVVTACSEETKASSDTALATDSAADAADSANGDATAAPNDTASGPDAVPDTGLDAGLDTATGTGGDTSLDAAPDSDVNSDCDYFEEPRIITCGDLLTLIYYWQDFGTTGCAPYYSAGADRFDTLAALTAAKGCSADCEYIARISVDIIGCSGQRTGFDEYDADGEGCLEAVYNTPVGILRDICDWQERSCYCTDGDGDTVVDGDDNCPEVKNLEQEDADGDELGDACDPCRDDFDNDVDVDGVCGDVDNCPTVSNPPSDCDSMPGTPLEQCDQDKDGKGDVCDQES